MNICPYVDAILDSIWSFDPIVGLPKIAFVECLSDTTRHIWMVISKTFSFWGHTLTLYIYI